MGKDEKSLELSRAVRARIIQKFGFIPESIMVADKSDKAWDPVAEKRSYTSTFWIDPKTGEPGESGLALSGAGARWGALSRFPQNIGRYLVQMYTEEGEIVGDPFSGHCSRLELVWRLNRHYIGIDVCHEFYEANLQARNRLYSENEQSLVKRDATITLFEADSRDLPNYVKENSVDMVLTSPPYYSLEFYDDNPAQLGRAKTYNDFLYSLSRIFENCMKVLKPGRFMCVETQDFRLDGRYCVMGTDFINILTRLGMEISDIIIVDYGASFQATFALDLVTERHSGRRHGYIVVARKYGISHEPDREKVRERLLEEAKEVKPEVPLVSQQKLFGEELPDI